MNDYENEEIEGQGALFPEDQLHEELDNTVGVGGSSPNKSPSPPSQEPHLSAVPSVPGEQMELSLGIPTEEEAHEMWMNTSLKEGDNSLYDLANRVYSQKRFDFDEHQKEEVISALMYEGMLALKAWKRDRGRSLVSYVWERMKRRIPRIVAQLNMNDIRTAANSNQLQKFDAIVRHFEELYPHADYPPLDEMEAEWVSSGEDPDLFRWLMQPLDHPDQDDVNKKGGTTEDGWSRLAADARPHVQHEHVPGCLTSMNDEEIWDYLFHEETLPLWTQELDADDFRVLDQRRADPEASARQIGRILGHDKNWVIRREDKIKRALKGFITTTDGGK